MNGRVYLDWNATAPLRAEAREAMIAAMDVVGNPSSAHAEGRAAKALIERAREDVAALVGCSPKEVVFTSGATEAAAVLSGLPAGVPVRVQPTAHDCVVAHRREGDAGDAAAVLALGVVNSETGIVTQPPERGEDGLFRLGDLAGGRLFLDVVQAAGREPFSFAWTGADFAILSAHKIGGSKGIGALILREGVDIETLRPGGGQEMGRRSGTENVIGIAGFGAAARAALADQEAGIWDRVRQMRDAMEARILEASPETIVVGRDLPRVANTSCLLTPGWKGETQVMQMDLAGIAVSAGSACSSGKVRVSRVLLAMGFDETQAGSAIRVSLGPSTTEQEIERLVAAWTAARARQRSRAA